MLLLGMCSFVSPLTHSNTFSFSLSLSLSLSSLKFHAISFIFLIVILVFFYSVPFVIYFYRQQLDKMFSVVPDGSGHPWQKYRFPQCCKTIANRDSTTYEDESSAGFSSVSYESLNSESLYVTSNINQSHV